MPCGPKRRDGSPLYRPRYRALARDRVRWVGDYVAFVVAETAHQAMDAAELIEVDYEPLPAIVSTADAIKPGAPLVWDDCPNNICFVHLEGDKAKTDAAFAKADKIVKHRFVINRVTAASMEPRGSIGVYRPHDDHYTIYTTLQRNFTFREELCKFVLKVPEHKVRVVSGDIGGSFGMKSAVYNEAALVLWAAKVTGRPVKWISTRSEAFLSDGQARDNVTDAELALDKDGNFLGLRVNIIANVGAFLQVGGQSFVGNLGTLAGVYKTPARVCRRDGGAHQHQSGAALSRQRPAGGGLCDRAHGRSRRRRARHRSGGAAAEELDPAGGDAVQDRAHLHLRLRRVREEHGRGPAAWPTSRASRSAARNRASAASCAGIGMSNTIERAAAPSTEGAEIRFDRGGTITLFSGSNNQGQGHETAFKQIVCDRLGVDPKDVTYISGDTDTVFYGEGTGGSRSATLGGSAVAAAADKVIEKGKKIAAHVLKVGVEDIKFEDGMFSSPKTNQTMTIGDVARAAANPAKLPKGMEVGLTATSIFYADVENFPNGAHVCEVEIDEETGQVDIVRYSVVDDVGTVINPLLVYGQITGGVAQGIGQILMEDIHFDPESGQLTTGSFMDYAMPRADNISALEHPLATRCRRRPIRSASRAAARPAASAPCRRSPTPSSTRCRSTASATSRCRRRRSASGARSRRRARRRLRSRRLGGALPARLRERPDGARLRAIAVVPAEASAKAGVGKGGRI